MNEQIKPKLWTAWTGNDIQMLKDMWEKHSASMIATKLSEKNGRLFTRNAVIGKINRLGLQGKGQPRNTPRVAGQREPRPPRQSKPVAGFEEAMQELASETQALFPEAYSPVAVVIDTPRLTDRDVKVVSLDLELPPGMDVVVNGDGMAPSGRVTLFDLKPGVCRFPIGDPLIEGFGFCGGACDVTRPYCSAHHKISYTPIVKHKKDVRKAYHR